jgi:hypothetical protein
MPIEIKELHIRVEVSAPPTGQPANGAATTPYAQTSGASNKDEIIAECVEQVLHILQSKAER